MTARRPGRSERIENAVQVLTLLAVGGMAGAASFTHMHDWTMDNVPAGTGDWFGWGNAVISELPAPQLTPLIAGLEVRRRRRNGEPVGAALAVLVTFAGLSLAAQFAQAKPGISGWLLAGLPAVAFMILIKLVLSRAPISAPAEAEVPAAVWQVERAEVQRNPEPVRAEVAAPAERKSVTAEAELPALPERKAEAEAPQVNALFPHPEAELPTGSGSGSFRLPERKSEAEVPPSIERKPARKSSPLVVAKRSPETTWKAAQEVMAANPELPLKTIAERVGVSDRRLRQIRTEMTHPAHV